MFIPKKVPCFACKHVHTFNVSNGVRGSYLPGEDRTLWAVTSCEKCGAKFKYTDELRDERVHPVD